MTITCRSYRSEYDTYKIRAFLCQVLLLQNRKRFNWPLSRWDYWRWHTNTRITHFKLDETVRLWETDDDALVAVLHPGLAGEFFLQIHPRQRTPALVGEMLSLAEEKFSLPTPGGARIQTWANDQDEPLVATLAGSGYTKTGAAEYQRWQLLDHPIRAAALPAGYSLRSLGDESDAKYAECDCYRGIQHIPTYRRELDLVVDCAGEPAAWATAWYDETTKTGAFEPLETLPAHRRKGLARALLTEGLRRLQSLGAVMAYASSYESAAHAACESAGFAQYDLCSMWEKRVEC